MKGNVPVTVDQSALAASVAKAAGQLGGLKLASAALSKQLGDMRANVDTTAAEAKIVALMVRTNALNKAIASAGPNTDPLRLESQLLGIQAAAEKLASTEGNVAAATQNVNIVSGNWFRTLTNIGGIGVPLFAGALGAMVPALDHADSGVLKLTSHLVNQTSGWHLLTEAVVETVAIWGPAAIAATAFGLAAVPTVIEITKQLQNMNTAATATGQQFASLATKGQSLTAAVKPSVMEAFGIGLATVQARSGTLAPVLASLGQAFDQLLAKASAALSSKAGGQFMQQASADLLALVQSFTSVGSILGTLMKAVPGYAEVLLGFGNDALHAGAMVTSAIEPVLAVFLKLHGAILYGGLAGTLGAKLFSGLVSGATAAVEAVAGLAAKFLSSDSAIVGSLGKVLLGLDALSAGPVIAGVGLLAGAFVGLVMYLKASKTAADDFNASIQKTLSSASLGSLQAQLRTSLTATATQYAAAQQKLAAANAQVTASQHDYVVAGRAGMLTTNNSKVAAEDATTAVNKLAAGQAQLRTQYSNVQANLAELAKTYGITVPQAISLASAAQVTSNQLMASGASNMATLKAQLAGARAEMAVFAVGAGQLNQALNALTVTQSTAMSDVQKVTQAYSQWIGVVSGGDSQFVAFEQGLTGVNARLSGTSAAALSARSAFDSEITSAVGLYGQLQTMATVSGNTAAAQVALSKAGRDLVAQLVPLAAGSQQATAQVFALAQIAGYAGPDALKSLATWAGNSKNAEADLNSQTAALTVSTANLTAAAKNLSAAVGSQVTAAEAQAIAQTANLSGTTLNLAKAFSQSQGAASAAVVTLAGQYYESLIKAGTGATTAEGDVNAFLGQLGATKGVVDQVDAALAKLPKQVNIGINVQVTEALSNQIAAGGATNAIRNALAQGGFERGGIVRAAGGYIVRGRGASGRDSQLILAAPGEMVVPTSHVPKYAAMAKRDGIPGFDGGGVPSPVFSTSGVPYSYASSFGGATYPAAPAATGQPGMPAATTYQAATTNQLLTDIKRLLMQQPYAYAGALQQAQAQGVRRGYFATSG